MLVLNRRNAFNLKVDEQFILSRELHDYEPAVAAKDGISIEMIRAVFVGACWQKKKTKNKGRKNLTAWQRAPCAAAAAIPDHQVLIIWSTPPVDDVSSFVRSPRSLVVATAIPSSLASSSLVPSLVRMVSVCVVSLRYYFSACLVSSVSGGYMNSPRGTGSSQPPVGSRRPHPIAARAC